MVNGCKDLDKTSTFFQKACDQGLKRACKDRAHAWSVAMPFVTELWRIQRFLEGRRDERPRKGPSLTAPVFGRVLHLPIAPSSEPGDRENPGQEIFSSTFMARSGKCTVVGCGRQSRELSQAVGLSSEKGLLTALPPAATPSTTALDGIGNPRPRGPDPLVSIPG